MDLLKFAVAKRRFAKGRHRHVHLPKILYGSAKQVALRAGRCVNRILLKLLVKALPAEAEHFGGSGPISLCNLQCSVNVVALNHIQGVFDECGEGRLSTALYEASQNGVQAVRIVAACEPSTDIPQHKRDMIWRARTAIGGRNLHLRLRAELAMNNRGEQPHRP